MIQRYDALAATRGLTAGLEDDWAAVHRARAGAATLSACSRATTRRRRRGRRGIGAARATARRWTCSTRRTRRSPRRASSATTSRRHDRRRDADDAGSTATRTTTRRCATCTRRCVEADGGSPTRSARPSTASRPPARQLPGGHARPLVVIMSDIAQGGLNQAVIAIEEARGSLAEALELQQQLAAGRRRRPGSGRAAIASAPPVHCHAHSQPRTDLPSRRPARPWRRIREDPSCRSVSSPASRGRLPPTSSSCPSSASPTSTGPYGELDRRSGGELAGAPGVRRAPRQALRHRARRGGRAAGASACSSVSAGHAEDLDRETVRKVAATGDPAADRPRRPARWRLARPAGRVAGRGRRAGRRARRAGRGRGRRSSPRRSTARTATPRRRRSTSWCSSPPAATPRR